MSAACKKVAYTGAKRAVLMEYADHANDDGICWPSRSRIMYNTGLSESAVKQHTRELREAGIIEIVAHHEGGRGRIPIYRVHPEKGPQKTPFKEWLKGSTRAERGQSEVKRGQEVTPESLDKNTSKESSISPRGQKPAKTLTTLTVDRTKEVGFEPSPHQIANWGNGWSRFVYVSEGEDPPSTERQFAVLQEIVGAASGKGGKARFFLAVEDAIKRVEGTKDTKPASEPELSREERAKRRTEGYEWLFGEAKPA